MDYRSNGNNGSMAVDGLAVTVLGTRNRVHRGHSVLDI